MLQHSTFGPVARCWEVKLLRDATVSDLTPTDHFPRSTLSQTGVMIVASGRICVLAKMRMRIGVEGVATVAKDFVRGSSRNGGGWEASSATGCNFRYHVLFAVTVRIKTCLLNMNVVMFIVPLLS